MKAAGDQRQEVLLRRRGATNCGRRPTTAKKDAQAARDGAAKTDRRARQRVQADVSDAACTFRIGSRRNEKPFIVDRDLHGRHVHLHQVGRPGTAGALRGARRRAESGQLPGRARRLHRAEGLESGYLVDREADAGVSSASGGEERHHGDPQTTASTGGPARADPRSHVAAPRRAAATAPDVADGRPRRRHPRHHSRSRAAPRRRREASRGHAAAEPSLMAPDRIRTYQQQLADDEARLQRELAQAPSAARGARPARRPAWARPSRRDPIADEQRRREYQSLFADNVALSRRPADATARMPSERRRHPRRPRCRWPPAADRRRGATSRCGQRAGGPRARRVVAAPRCRSRRVVHRAPACPRSQTAHRARGTGPIRRPIALQRLLEGTVIETVLLNRLDGTFAGPGRLSGHDAGLFARPAARRHSRRRPRARRRRAGAELGRLAARRELSSAA